ncbi:hypothetical protein LEMLEM_LOCUS14387 [Lemmus lemmus]
MDDVIIAERVSIAGIKHHDQKQLGEERVYFTVQLSGQTPLLREFRARTQDRNPEAGANAEAWRNTAYWLMQKLGGILLTG